MRMTANYEPESELLVLRYDVEAQAIFAKTAKIMSEMLHPGGAPSRFEADPEWYEDIGQNTEILTRLGAEPSRSLRTRREILLSLLNLACGVTLRMLDEKRETKQFSDLLMLLAVVTPVEIISDCLPPAAEVLNKKSQSAAWTALEMLRSWNGDEFPQMPFFQAYTLRLALSEIPKPSKALQALVMSLDANTCLFRLTMETMARNNVAKATRGRRKI